MGIAYTAKAEAEGTEPPEGWPPEWPYPSDDSTPLPPGFPEDEVDDPEEEGTEDEHEYSLIASVTDPVYPHTTPNLTLAFKKDGSSSGVWRGQLVKVTSSHPVRLSASDDWGTTFYLRAAGTTMVESLYIDIDEANDGETLTLTPSFVTLTADAVAITPATAAIESAPSFAVDLPENVESNTPFTFTIQADTPGGIDYDGYEGAGASLVWEIAEDESGPWAPLVVSGGDLSSGWDGSGGWSGSATVVNVGSLFSNQVVRVSVVYDSATAATDTALIDPDVELALIDAIRERQIACGITTEWTSANPYEPTNLIDNTGTADYGVAHYQAYVNAIAVNFIDGEYTPGTGVPDMLTSSYADDYETIADLYTAVCAMLVIKDTANLRDYQVWYGQNEHYAEPAEGIEPWATVKSGAVSAFALVPGAAQVSPAMKSGLAQRDESPDWMRRGAQLKVDSLQVEVEDMGTHLPKSVKLYARAYASGITYQYYVDGEVIFDKMGESIPDEGYFGLIRTMSVDAAENSVLSTPIPAVDTPEWPAEPVSSYYYATGWKLEDWFALIEYDFSHR